MLSAAASAPGASVVGNLTLSACREEHQPESSGILWVDIPALKPLERSRQPEPGWQAEDLSSQLNGTGQHRTAPSDNHSAAEGTAGAGLGNQPLED